MVMANSTPDYSITSTGTEIVCPRGKGAGMPIIINIRDILELESRTDEIQTLTPQKAGELMSLFIKAWRELHRNVSMLTKELDDAVRYTERVKAKVILDRVPEELKKRNLLSARSPAGSEDLRESVLALDEEYQSSLDKAQEIRCITELLKGKLRSFQMAYESVKKLLGEGSLGFHNNLNSPLNVSGNEFVKADKGDDEFDW